MRLTKFEDILEFLIEYLEKYGKDAIKMIEKEKPAGFGSWGEFVTTDDILSLIDIIGVPTYFGASRYMKWSALARKRGITYVTPEELKLVRLALFL